MREIIVGCNSKEAKREKVDSKGNSKIMKLKI